MPNFDRYNQIHSEIMKRLESGEITVEQAKDVTDLAFDKYIVEASTENASELQKIRERLKTLNKEYDKAEASYKKLDDMIDKADDHGVKDTRKQIDELEKKMKDIKNEIKSLKARDLELRNKPANFFYN